MSPPRSLVLVALLGLALCAILVSASSGLGEHLQRVSPRHPAPAPQQTQDDFQASEFMSAWRKQKQMENAMTEAPLQALSWNYGQNGYTMQRPEGERSYYVYVPRSYKDSKKVSLVLLLHGLGDTGLKFSTRTNMTTESELRGFVLIYPQGTSNSIGTAWNAGTCCADQNKNVDDVGFLLAIVSQVRGTFNIRPESIHSMGFSNGGFMSERLACERGDVFTSIGSVSGGTILKPGNAGGLQACDNVYKSPVHVFHMHGTADTTVPWNGESLLGFPSVAANMAAWRARNGCPANGAQTFAQGTFSGVRWKGCSKGNTVVELVTNDGGAHIYPLPGVANNPTNWSVTQAILNFFHMVTPGGL